MTKLTTPKVYCLAGGLAVSEQHVEDASGQGAPLPKVALASEQIHRARISTVGKSERCCEEIAKTGPAKQFTLTYSS